MQKQPIRTVLAFFRGEAGHADRAWNAVQRLAHASIIRGNENNIKPSLRTWAAMRLDNEVLISAEAPVAKIPALITELQSSGSPVICIVRSNAVAPEPEKRDDAEPEVPARLDRRGVIALLRKYREALRSADMDLAEARRLEHAVSPAAEWVVDNSYLIYTQIEEVQKLLPRELLRSRVIPGTGHSRIFPTALQFLAKTDFAVNSENIRTCLREAQVASPLTIAEVWSFPLFLRLGLIKAVADLAIAVNRSQQLRELAFLWANRLATAARDGDETFARILRELESEPSAREPHFLIALAEQLQDEELALGPAQQWIESVLGEPLVETVRKQHGREASQTLSAANAFGSLRLLAHLDFKSIFEDVSVVERELRQDPAGIYPSSDFETRDRCRRAVERLARYGTLSEDEVARLAVRLATEATEPRTAHVGYYLISNGLTELERETKARIPALLGLQRWACGHATPLYAGSIAALTASFAAVAWSLAMEAGLHSYAVLAFLTACAVFPLSELCVQVVNALVIAIIPPEPLPKLDFREGVPESAATLVVVPMMLTSFDAVHHELEKLEVRFLGNRDANIYFSLFADFTDAPEATAANDAAILDLMRAGIAGLNSKYPLAADDAGNTRFLLFHRQRVWSESEQRWIGRERKRGKLEELNAFLCGAHTDRILVEGALKASIAYVITLDADTQLPPEAARLMIQTIAHPLNKVEVDAATGVRRYGYTIIQPRVSISLPGATATRFTRIFADASGTDPYSRIVSDAQQDFFLEGIFHGKAIYDVRAFHSILGDRFPVETILSHDLIEGAHAGVALASDVQLFEHIPVDYASFANRQHRWTRGDWQIARWAFRRVPTSSGALTPNPLSFLHRWRILDNLRRSLVPVAAMLLLLLGWLTRAAPGVWTLVVAVAIGIPAVTPILDRAAHRLQGAVHRWTGAADELFRALVMIAFLPHQAWISVDAIVRVFYRRYVSRRNLLEWTTAEHTHKEGHKHRDATLRQLYAIASLSGPLAIALYIEHEFLPTAFFLFLWAGSPFIVQWLARPQRTLARKQLNAEETLMLRSMARETWRFFDDLVGPETNWLPPDNSQLALRVEVAQRTSPTNIGLWMTSALSARDFGYLTPDDFCARCQNTFETLARMERYEGHLLNWYDTRTLEPLNPRYVSTVDSGNLVAAFWVLGQGCEDILHAPILGNIALRGLSDTLSILERKIGDDPSVAAPLRSIRRILRATKETHAHDLLARFRMATEPVQKVRDSQRWHLSETDERSYWATRLQSELSAWLRTGERYLAWMELLASPPDSSLLAISPDAPKLRRRALHHTPSLAILAGSPDPAMQAVLRWAREPHLRAELRSWLEELAASYEAARASATQAVTALRGIASQAATLSDGINMRFLYDEQRKLFGVGYSVGGPREFNSHYDLLASECRLSSLVSIAKADVPAEHWFSLSRPLTWTANSQTLLSWSGTMFEYMMPLLFARNFTNSLLEHACRDALQRQIEYGNSNDVPWGISESAWSALDSHHIYQYRAFGVPSLALNPGTEDQLVVSPYSSVLALQVDPGAAADNLKRLRNMKMWGPMGLYEAIDFSRQNNRSDRGVIIYCYMAHHQGMSLAALNNVLHRDVLQRRFHADLRIRSVESLLFEGVPITRRPLLETRGRSAPVRAIAEEDAIDRIWTEDTLAPRVHLYGNGRYSIMVSNAGGSYSRWNDFDLTRWRSDPTLDSYGAFIYVRDTKSDERWCATHKCDAASGGDILVRFSSDHAEVHRRVSGIDSNLDITVATDDDVEIRRLRITNRSLRARTLELTSYLELAMASHGADKAHPAFSRMFVQTESPRPGVLIGWRRQRSPGDPPVWMAHVIQGITPEDEASIQHETDRAKFLARGTSPKDTIAWPKTLSGSTGTVIDPVFALRGQTTLDPRERREFAFLTFAAASKEALMALIDKYASPEAISRAFEMAWTRAQLEFRFLRIGPGAAHRFQELASQMIYPGPRLRAPAERTARNRLGQETLWAYGISGDLPMLVITVNESRSLGVVREVLAAQAYWRLRGFIADVIVLNQEAPGYDQPLHAELERQLQAHAGGAGIDKPGGVFLRDWHSMPEEHRTLILASARVVLNAARGPLQQQIASGGKEPPPPPFVATGASEEPSRPLPFLELPYFNGLGGFTPDGREYAIYLKPGDMTPAPWVNVIANAGFGTMVTEGGLGCTWAVNSQANRLTPWHNDAVSDPQSEIIYIRDDESGAIWSPTPLPRREKDAYRARHGQGYTTYEHNSHAIGVELTVFVPVGQGGEGDPVKVCRLRLRNDSSRNRRLTVTHFVEWTLGPNREDMQTRVRTSRDDASGALLATQYWNGTARGHVAFTACSPRANSWTCDRSFFLGPNGTRTNPEALGRIRLDNRTGIADPCAAQQVTIPLDRGQQTEIIFLLGQVPAQTDIAGILSRCGSPAAAEAVLAAARQFWDDTLGAVQVRTPALSVDVLVNRWLLYQSLSCRFWGRTALYQSGGAFGFRDQLQDSMAYFYAAPGVARSHILRSAARQFSAGDVQHWWHPESGMGVRTLCSDDLLWLPFVVSRYVAITGDVQVLQESVPFLDGPPLGEHEHERMFTPNISEETAPLWEHCRRAIDCAWKLGPHGIPLMGNGDWNDGMKWDPLESTCRHASLSIL